MRTRREGLSICPFALAYYVSAPAVPFVRHTAQVGADTHEGRVALAMCAYMGKGCVAAMLPQGAEATAAVAEGVAAPVVLVLLLHHGTTNNDAVTVHWVVCCALLTGGRVSGSAQQVCMHM